LKRNHDDHAPRILGGTLRGRRLEVAPGKVTRPLKVLARRSLFDSLAPRLPGAVVLDLFAGSGALAIEALSRGAARAVLVERERAAARAIAANLTALGLDDRAALVAGDAAQHAATAPEHAFDLVFCCPPFAFFEGDPGFPAASPRTAAAGRGGPVISAVLAALPRLLAPDGLLVLEVPAGREPPTLRGLARVRTDAYGASVLHRYQPDAQVPVAPGR
jgi:16S rRNA (guanine966-N2)-methyltransferase